MDLILWRHAEAEEGENDLARELTPKGQKQAARVAEWLLQRLPAKFALLSSPAARAQQTAEALGVPVKTVKDIAPGASVSAIIKAAGWPDQKATVVLVGHQPDLGHAAAFLVSGTQLEVSIKKGGLWWLNDRAREDGANVVVRAVLSPDLL
ncbi:MAG: SixA phosphatase family protein [Burkholderiales bacterium]